MSRPVVITPYRPEWPSEFLAIGRRIRRAVGSQAIRIDHTGSTAVEGLAAKDVIDIQVTVDSLEESARLLEALAADGFRRRDGYVYDEFHGMAEMDVELRKLYVREPLGE